MAHPQRLPQMLSLSVTTDSSGDWTETTGTITGTLRQVRLDSVDLDAGSDLTIVGDTTGTTYLSNANSGTDETFYPLAVANVASTGAAAADPAYVPHVVAEPLVVTIAQGGNVTTGTIYISYE